MNIKATARQFAAIAAIALSLLSPIATHAAPPSQGVIIRLSKDIRITYAAQEGECNDVIKVTVTNSGSLSTGLFNVGILRDGHLFVETIAQMSLAPWESRTITFDTGYGNQSYDLDVLADWNGMVSESNESNNSAYIFGTCIR